jgi:hypothetical protein
MFCNHMRLPRATVPLLCVAASVLLAGCDQSINSSGLGETTLTGMYCDAKGDQEQSCQAGDVIVTVQGRERLVCDWGWQIIHEPGSDDVLCVHRGQLRDSRPAASNAH